MKQEFKTKMLEFQSENTPAEDSFTDVSGEDINKKTQRSLIFGGLGIFVLLAVVATFFNGQIYTAVIAPLVFKATVSPAKIDQNAKATIKWTTSPANRAKYPYEKISACLVVNNKTSTKCKTLVAATPNDGKEIVTVSVGAGSYRAVLQALDAKKKALPGISVTSNGFKVSAKSVASGGGGGGGGGGGSSGGSGDSGRPGDSILVEATPTPTPTTPTPKPVAQGVPQCAIIPDPPTVTVNGQTVKLHLYTTESPTTATMGPLGGTANSVTLDSGGHAVVVQSITSTGVFRATVTNAQGSSTCNSSTVLVNSPHAAMLGAQNVYVILVNYQDLSLAAPASVFNNFFFSNDATSLNSFYKESSSNKASLTGGVYGPYTIAIGSADCSGGQNTPLDAAKAAFWTANPGLDRSVSRIFVFPAQTGSCSNQWNPAAGNTLDGSWEAVIPDLAATTSANPDYSPGTPYFHIYSHEYAHTLGMTHANSIEGEYNDASCTMGGPPTTAKGGPGAIPFNAAQRLQVGWLGSQVQTVTSSGTYTIEALESSSQSATKVLQIDDTNTGFSTIVSYRTATGTFGASLGSTFANKTNVHWWRGSTSASLLRAELADQESDVEGYTGVTVRQLSHDATSATVEVTISAPTCTPVLPSVSIDPTTASVAQGSTADLTVSVTNNDEGTACPTMPYFAAHDGTSVGKFTSYTSPYVGSQAPLLISSKQTKSYVLHLTAGGSATAGDYTVIPKILDGGLPLISLHNLPLIFTPVSTLTVP